jgi:hypothetical protein
MKKMNGKILEWEMEPGGGRGRLDVRGMAKALRAWEARRGIATGHEWRAKKPPGGEQ